MRTMTLCPGCHSIRKAGTTCPLCTCPVPEASVTTTTTITTNNDSTKKIFVPSWCPYVTLITAAASGGTTKKIVPASNAEAIARLQNRDVFCD